MLDQVEDELSCTRVNDVTTFNSAPESSGYRIGQRITDVLAVHCNQKGKLTIDVELR